MHDNANLVTATPKRVPWNKGKLIGPRPPLRQKHVWQSGLGCRLSSKRAIWRCSIWRSIASCVAATLSQSGSMTLRRMAMRSSERPCDRKRPVDRCDLS
jgi:hypothetical protein